MARSVQHHRGPSGQSAIPHGGQPADIVELIMANHRRIRRLHEVLDDAVRRGGDSGSSSMLADTWQRLTELLEAHSRAEEEICYLPMFGATGRAAQQRRAAIDEHDEIREATREAALQPVGSALWWGAVRSVVAVSAEHLDREEREMLEGWLPQLTMSRRRELGHQWLAFIAAYRLDETRTAHVNPPAAG